MFQAECAHVQQSILYLRQSIPYVSWTGIMLLPVGMRTLPLPLPPLPMCPGIDSSLNYPLDLVKRFQLCTGFCVCTNTCVLTEGNRNANASRQAFVHWPSWCCLTGCGEESIRKLVLVLPADGTEMCWYKKLQILFFSPSSTVLLCYTQRASLLF